eukprot:COSAG06_NODE_1480_length_9321_cov_14.755042_3_plen_121_part_00
MEGSASHLEDRLLCGDEELLGRVEGLPLVHQDLGVGAAKVNPKVEAEAARKPSVCFSFPYVTSVPSLSWQMIVYRTKQCNMKLRSRIVLQGSAIAYLFLSISGMRASKICCAHPSLNFIH